MDRRVAALYAARAERDALERNRAGDFEGAAAILRRCAERIERYEGSDEALRGIARGLREKVGLYSRDFDRLLAKFLHYQASSSLKGRYMGARIRQTQAQQRGITILPTAGVHADLEAVVRALAAADTSGLASLTVSRGLSARSQSQKPILSPDQEDQLVADALHLDPHAALRIVLVQQHLIAGGPCSWHPSQKTAIVSVAGWNGDVGAPVEAFLAFAVAQQSLRLAGRGLAPELLAHEDARGCLFDFCASASELARLLSAPRVCPPCRSALEAAGLPGPTVDLIAEAIRGLAAPVVVH